MPKIEKHVIDFRISGPLIEKAWPLREVNKAFSHLQFLLDTAFAIAYDIKGKEVQGRLLVNIQSIEKGSLQAKLELIMATVQLTITGALIPAGPKEAWQLVRDSYSYLKAVFTLANSGTEPKVIVESDVPGISIRDSQIVVNGGVHIHAQRCEKHFKGLSKLVDGGKIDELSAFDDAAEGFLITPAERELFNPGTKIAKDPVEGTAKIFEFNVYDFTGRLEITDSEQLPIGNYHFSAQDKTKLEQYVFALLDKPVRIFALKEVALRPHGKERVVRLIVYSVDAASD
jgi:hypothetical protein